jgi:uncharacterized protein
MNSTMKHLVTVTVASLLLCAPAAFADQASKNAKIEEMLALTNASQMINQVFEQMKAMETAQLSKMDVPADKRQAADQIQQKILQLLQDSLSWDKLKPKMIEIYAATFTEEEIDGILNFYKSPAGQAMLQKMPQLVQRSMAMTQQMAQEIMPRVQDLVEQMKAQEKNGAGSSPPQ